MPLAVLWDVDNTLIDNAGVSKEIYAQAFRNLTGRAPDLPARTEGRTDPDIMAEMLQRNRVPASSWPETAIALEDAGRSRAPRLAKRGRVLPGVHDLLGALQRLPDVVQTVVSGNIRANAAAKLRPLHLLDHFDLDVGAFGSDHSHRPQLVLLACSRVAAKYSAAFQPVVIGDTPRDVEAGLLAGCPVIAVATGTHSVETLRRAGATDVVPDLSDTASILALLSTLESLDR